MYFVGDFDFIQIFPFPFFIFFNIDHNGDYKEHEKQVKKDDGN